MEMHVFHISSIIAWIVVALGANYVQWPILPGAGITV